MNKQYFYLAGLPRSGSTVLANILMQNSDIYVSETSTLPLVIESVKNQWDGLITNQTIPHELSRVREKAVLRGIIEGFHENVNKPIVIDKNRQWPALLETLAWVFDEPPKMIATVRDLRQVVESFEALYKKTAAVGMPTQFQGQGLTTAETRAKTLVAVTGVVGSAYEILRDAIIRGWTPNILFVRYEDLGGNPAGIMQQVYEFLELPIYEHNFENIEQVTEEDDRIHGFEDLHDIEPVLRPAKQRNVLAQLGDSFAGRNFWENL
jgi:sulfotransferase